jgi:membrane peptidoglycan carboxypeptidase
MPGGDKPLGPDGGVPERTSAADGADRPTAALPTSGAASQPEFAKPEEPEPADRAEPADQAGRADRAQGVDEADRAAEPGRPGGSPVDAGAGAGAGAGKKTRSRRNRYARRAAFTLFGIIGFLMLAFGIAYLLTPVPSPQEKAVEQGPSYYYSDGKTLIAKVGTNREKVDLDDVPDHVREAVIAAENRSFYDDPGVSVRGTVRAFWSTISGEQLQGGSTITQQMVRNYYQGLGQERTVTRKLKEIMVALKVGSERDKDWILEQYLNTIYFGRDAYGIQAAAKAYYGKDVKNLSPAQAAYLAAAIQQPTPFGTPTSENRAAIEQRWRSVVDAMVITGALPRSETAALKFPKPVKMKQTDVLGGQHGYMVNIARKELMERRGYSEDQINRSGLKIVTTFSKSLMDAAETAVESAMPKETGRKTRVGLVSIDPSSGKVVAFYGGRNFLDEELSTAFGENPQAGSGFKPVALAAALDDGIKLNHVVDGSSPQTFDGKEVPNNNGTSYGMINLVTATQNSVNTAYVNLAQEVGLDKVTKMAEELGIPRSQLTANDANEVPTFPLGVASVKVVQQAGVYATFAAEGVYHRPYVVQAVTDSEGETRKFSEKDKRVFSQQVARDASYAMSQVVRSGTGTGAQLYDGRDVAGKTGTTDNGNALWFNGYIPQLATSVSIFRTDGTKHKVQVGSYSAFGGVLPAQIWRTYTSKAVEIEDLPIKSFGSPSNFTGGGGGGTYTNRPNPRPTAPRGTVTRPAPPSTPAPRPTKTNPPPTTGPIKPPKPSEPLPTLPPIDNGGRESRNARLRP